MVEEQSLFECEKDELATTDVVEEISTDENIDSNEEDLAIEFVDSDESPKAREERIKSYGEKVEADGKILTIIDTGYTNIKNKDENGNFIPPTKTLSGEGDFYPIKLRVLFEDEEGNRIVEYYPSVKVWCDKDGNLRKTKDGKIIPMISRPNVSNSAVAKLFKLYAEFVGKEVDEISDKEFREGLIGKKVKIKITTGEFAKRKWFRNDIKEFIK